MAVDLNDLVESLKREVSPPGATVFAAATDDDWLGHLVDAFWMARLDGLLTGYKVDDNGAVTPIQVGGTDLTRDLQQIVVLYAGIRIVLSHLRTINTLFRSKAGPVEFETQHSAQVLKGVLDELKDQRNLILRRLSDLGSLDSYYIDSIITRDLSIQYGNSFWVN